MRLIDADALERHVYTEWVNGELSNSEWVDFRQWLKDEPTVEPDSPWHRVEEEPEKNGAYVVWWNYKGSSYWFRGVFFDGRWLFEPGTPLPDYWMPIEPPKEDA